MRRPKINSAGTAKGWACQEACHWPRYKKAIARPKPQPGQPFSNIQLKGHKENKCGAAGSKKTSDTKPTIQHSASVRYHLGLVIFKPVLFSARIRGKIKVILLSDVGHSSYLILLEIAKLFLLLS